MIILDAAIQQISGFTTFRGRIDHNCAAGSALYHLYSQHDNGQEDRRWRFGCRMISLTRLTSCHWTPQNILDQMLIAHCPAGFAAAGFRSVSYSTPTRDRQFSVKCCKSATVSKVCKFSGYINNWDAVMNYNAPNGEIITGIYSHHENSKE